MTKNSDTGAEAVALAKETGAGETIVERHGVRARIVGVASGVTDAAKQRIKYPPVPMWLNPDKDREEPNPNDPAYIQACSESDIQRGAIYADTMILFGIELLDPLPEDGLWLKKLQLLERMGHTDLSAFDLDDPIDLEFVFKRYYFSIASDILLIGRKNRLTPEAIRIAADSF